VIPILNPITTERTEAADLNDLWRARDPCTLKVHHPLLIDRWARHCNTLPPIVGFRLNVWSVGIDSKNAKVAVVAYNVLELLEKLRRRDRGCWRNGKLVCLPRHEPTLSVLGWRLVDRFGDPVLGGEHNLARFECGMRMHKANAKAVVVFRDKGDEFREKSFAVSLFKAVVCDLDIWESVIETLQVRHVDGCSRCTGIQELYATR